MIEPTTEIAEAVCLPMPGMAHASEWRTANSAGFSKNGKTYCCEGCATGGHCTCELLQTAPRLERNTDETKTI